MLKRILNTDLIYLGTDTKSRKIRVSGIKSVEDIPTWLNDQKLALLVEKIECAQKEWLSYCSYISFTDIENQVSVWGLSKEKDALSDENYPEDFISNEAYIFNLDK